MYERGQQMLSGGGRKRKVKNVKVIDPKTEARLPISLNKSQSPPLYLAE